MKTKILYILRITAAVILLLHFFGNVPLKAQTFFTLRGNVNDSLTKEPLPAANIRILGTSKGTITNTNGNYTLTLDSSAHTIVFSYLAYQPESVMTALKGPAVLNIMLKPSPIQMPEVVVLAEDPAVDIIRKAIAHKRAWMDRLKSYTFEAFTRQVLRRDSTIASITEAYTTGFMSAGDTLREIVKQRRQTENIPSKENFAAVRGIVNFNEDEINLFSVRVGDNSTGYKFVGPTAPDALDNYDYKLLKTSTTSGVDVYQIRMKPKTRLKPLFDGEITIAEGTFAVMGVDVKPNESFTIPFIKDIELRYRQQFALYESQYWMPVDVRISGFFSISILGLSVPRVGLDILSAIYDYKINAPIPDSLSGKPRLVVDSAAIVYDSTFWKANEVVPLTPEEQVAYKSLDSTRTLEKQFEPKGPLAALGAEGTETVLDLADVRFNRVEGFYLGGKKGFNALSNLLRIDAGAGYAISGDRFNYQLGLTLFASKERKIGLGGSLYSKTDYTPDGGFYGPLAISLMALIDKNDYRDYYLANGWKLFLTIDPNKRISATLSFVAERQYTLYPQTDYSLISRMDAYRPNPAAAEGSLRSINLNLRFGDREVPLDLVSRNALEISVEHTSPSIAGSEFSFTRYNGMISWSLKTFSRGLLFPPALRARVSAGKGFGTLPPQRMFFPDTRSSGYAPFGVLHASSVKEFSGDAYVMVNLEHNFRSLPFLALNIPFLYRNGIELVVQGSLAKTWNRSAPSFRGWYTEAGIGISRILDLLRADLTYRFMNPRIFYFSVSIANLF